MIDDDFWWRGMIAANTTMNTVLLRVMLRTSQISAAEIKLLIAEAVQDIDERRQSNPDIPEKFYASAKAHLEKVAEGVLGPDS